MYWDSKTNIDENGSRNKGRRSRSQSRKRRHSSSDSSKLKYIINYITENIMIENIDRIDMRQKENRDGKTIVVRQENE